MSYRIADRKAELLYQVSETSFRFKLENGVEVTAEIESIDFEPDCFLVETLLADDQNILCTVAAL